MGWICFQATVESVEHSGRGCEQWRIVKSSNTATAFLCPKCHEVGLTELQSGMTCERCGENTSAHRLTLSQEASPARTLALQEMERAWTESEADYSSKSLGLLASFDRASCSWKTSQASLFEELTELPQNWPRMGMWDATGFYPLTMWERRTSAKESGLLPTPIASDADKDPTDSLSRMVRLWPTPAARDYRSPGSKEGYGRRTAAGHQQALNEEAVHREGLIGGQLNPEWVEWLMGLPIGATELEPWATELCPRRQKKRSSVCSELKEVGNEILLEV